MTKDENGNILFASLEEALEDARQRLAKLKGRAGAGADLQRTITIQRIAELETRIKFRDFAEVAIDKR